jgi:hypothetical protein
MGPSDEELLHAFYAGDAAALEGLMERHSPLLEQVALLILQARAGSRAQALGEWDLSERVGSVWVHVRLTREAAFGVWPHQRLSALACLIYLLCQEMDRHLDLHPPF